MLKLKTFSNSTSRLNTVPLSRTNTISTLRNTNNFPRFSKEPLVGHSTFINATRNISTLFSSQRIFSTKNVKFQKNERRNALERDYMKRNSKNELQRFHIHPFAQLSRSFASEKKSGKKIGDFEWGDTVDAVAWTKTEKPPGPIRAFAMYPRALLPGFASLLGPEDKFREELLQVLREQPDLHTVGFFIPKTKDGVVKKLDDLNKVGVVSVVALAKLLSQPSDVKEEVVVFTMYRAEITGVSEDSTDGKLIVNIQKLEDEPYDPQDKQVLELHGEILAKMKEIKDMGGPAHAGKGYQSNDLREPLLPGDVADMAVNYLSNPDPAKIQELLETLNVKERQKKMLQLLTNEVQKIETSHSIHRQLEENMTKTNRRYLLNEQLKLIKRELGLERDEKQTIIEKFQERLKTLTVPEAVLKVINEEIAKLSTLESSAEASVTRNYLDWLTSLPWGLFSTETLDVKRAAKVLEEDHYGLRDVKERIQEFIAVGNLKKGLGGKILCFVGPPGVGKTSIGKSVARSLNREFYRFSVGGLHDVAEIKGHRRTYIGAMPGKIIQCLKSVKTSNPVILIDEIDKMGHHSFHGDPASALLEVLDPEQNKTFLDHYLDVPYDLSKVLFITTANVKDTIPKPLLDRMEVIPLAGYIIDEKIAIAKKHLIPAATDQSGLKKWHIDITDEAVRALVKGYCREAGVRNLQKHIEKICRKVAHKVVTGTKKRLSITDKNLSDFVGKPVFTSDKYYETTPVGVVMGLAYTAMGGASLYVETVADKGSSKPGLQTTGQLGDVMKESTNIAYTFAKGFVDEVSHGNRFFETCALHMHVPEGAVPKDGPSAGITMTTSLVSLAIGRPVKQNLAMTGELTLTGKVLPIGGVKEKTIAARMSGITNLIFPKDNRKDFEELPVEVKEGFEVYFVDYYKDVYEVAFGDKKTTAAAKLKGVKYTKKSK